MRHVCVVLVCVAMAGAVLGCRSTSKDPVFTPPDTTLADAGTTYGTGSAASGTTSLYTGLDTPLPGTARDSIEFSTGAERPVVARSTDGGQAYVVQKGDTLYALARRFYNDQSQWRRIYNANQPALSNPNLLKVGQVLTIPQ